MSSLLAHDLPTTAHEATQPLHDPNGVGTRSLRMITCGSVDDGKSTLIGRLLWDTKSVFDDHADALPSSNTDGADGLRLPEFAMLVDGLQAEREQGITIDVAYRYFTTPTRSFIIADTPGHEQYTRNMATGCSTADLAVLLVDARVGLLEQTKRHATIASLMGVTQFILIVNKIDLADYDEEIYLQIAKDFSEFALSIDIKDITTIPASALKGENVVVESPQSMPWYNGPTLLQAMELASTLSPKAVGFRLPVQRVSRPDESFRGYQGTIAGGSIKPGDSVVVLPSGVKANVSKIVTFDLIRNAGVAGDAVTLVLDRPVDISRGDMISSTDAQPWVGRSFKAKLIALQQEGIVPGRRYWLKSSSRRQRVTVRPTQALDLKTGQWADADKLPLNTIGEVVLEFEDQAMFDSYTLNRHTGSFVLIDPDNHNTVAGGMIVEPSSQPVAQHPDNEHDAMFITLPRSVGHELISKLTESERNLVRYWESDDETSREVIARLEQT